MDVAVNMRLVEFGEDVARKALDAEAQHAESGVSHGCQALVRHGIDAVGADELQFARHGAAFLAGNDRLAQRQNAPILGEHEDIILKDDRAHSGVCADDTLNHLHTLFGIEPRNARHTSLGFVQEVCGGAEGATHRAVVQRDQAYRADLSESGLAGSLRRQGADAIRLFEVVPVAAGGHLSLGGAEYWVAPVFPFWRPLWRSPALPL